MARLFQSWTWAIIAMALRARGPVPLLILAGCTATARVPDPPACVTVPAGAGCCYATTNPDGTRCCRELAP